jgi:hypothetical protein
LVLKDQYTRTEHYILLESSSKFQKDEQTVCSKVIL